MYLELMLVFTSPPIEASMYRLLPLFASCPINRSKLCREIALTYLSVLVQVQSLKSFLFSPAELPNVASATSGEAGLKERVVLSATLNPSLVLNETCGFTSRPANTFPKT